MPPAAHDRHSRLLDTSTKSSSPPFPPRLVLPPLSAHQQTLDVIGSMHHVGTRLVAPAPLQLSPALWALSEPTGRQQQQYMASFESGARMIHPPFPAAESVPIFLPGSTSRTTQDQRQQQFSIVSPSQSPWSRIPSTVASTEERNNSSNVAGSEVHLLRTMMEDKLQLLRRYPASLPPPPSTPCHSTAEVAASPRVIRGAAEIGYGQIPPPPQPRRRVSDPRSLSPPMGLKEVSVPSPSPPPPPPPKPPSSEKDKTAGTMTTSTRDRTSRSTHPAECKTSYPWQQDEDERLMKGIAKYGPYNGIPWEKVADLVETRTAKQCRARYYNRSSRRQRQPSGAGRVQGRNMSRQSEVQQQQGRRPWSWEEHERLVNAVVRYGPKWDVVASAVGTRTAKECTIHAYNYLYKVEEQQRQRRGQRQPEEQHQPPQQQLVRQQEQHRQEVFRAVMG